MNFLREGDELIVSEFSLLARLITDLLNIVETLTKKDVKVRSLKEQLDSSTPQGKFMLTIFGFLKSYIDCIKSSTQHFARRYFS